MQRQADACCRSFRTEVEGRSARPEAACSGRNSEKNKMRTKQAVRPLQCSPWRPDPDPLFGGGEKTLDARAGASPPPGCHGCISRKSQVLFRPEHRPSARRLPDALDCMNTTCLRQVASDQERGVFRPEHRPVALPGLPKPQSARRGFVHRGPGPNQPFRVEHRPAVPSRRSGAGRGYRRPTAPLFEKTPVSDPSGPKSRGDRLVRRLPVPAGTATDERRRTECSKDGPACSDRNSDRQKFRWRSRSRSFALAAGNVSGSRRDEAAASTMFPPEQRPSVQGVEVALDCMSRTCLRQVAGDQERGVFRPEHRPVRQRRCDDESC